jgi:amidase
VTIRNITISNICKTEMKRRAFITSTALAGSAFTVAGLSSCSRPERKAGKEESTTNMAEFELNEATIAGLQARMASGELTSAAICSMYLDRIAAVDTLLRSVIELNPDAMEIAKQMDDERKSGNVRGPLHGIPIMIKDNIDTGDKMMTTAGSLALSGNIAGTDAPVVARLRAAGAVLLGKTNLSEWANFRSTRSSSGWSGRGGQVRNPYCLDRSPCGSSAGTGAAVAANLCAIGIGTETNGSIVCPSGVNGLVGIKPTLGLWSRRGIIPIAHSQDTAGPMCRNVSDAATLLGTLAGFDDDDAETHVPRGTIYNDYTQFLDTSGLEGARIGIAREMLGFHPEIDKLFDQAVEVLKTRGAEVIDNISFQNRRNWGGPSYQVMLYEFKADLNKYLEEHPAAPVRSMEEIIAFNEANADKEMPWFGQEIFKSAQEKGDLSTNDYQKALADSKRFTQKDGIDAVMEEHRLDAIIAATNGPAWNIDWINGDHFSGSSSSPAAISGYPNISVPMGNVHGLPAGISFFGKAWSEPVLIKLAYAYEQATKHRMSPGFLSTLMK